VQEKHVCYAVDLAIVLSIKNQFEGKMDISCSMRSVTYAYHVTNIPSDRNEFYDTLKLTISNDHTYDGTLVGLQCLFFSTTLYNGGLPKKSVYPRNLPGTFKRVSVPLSAFDNHEMWKIKGTRPEQVHILMVTKQQRQRLQLENLWGQIGFKLDDNNSWLKREKTGGQTVWYTNDYLRDRCFVNLAIVEPFVLNNACKWDSVEKMSTGVGRLQDLTDLLVDSWIFWHTQAKLKTECDGLQAEFDELQEERDELETERDQLQDECDELQDERDELETERDQLQEERDELETERDELQEERDELQEERDELETENCGLKKECRELRTKFSVLQTQIADIRQLFSKKNDKFSTLMEKPFSEQLDELQTMTEGVNINKD